MSASTTTMVCPCCYGQRQARSSSCCSPYSSVQYSVSTGDDSNGNDCQWTDTRIVPCPACTCEGN